MDAATISIGVSLIVSLLLTEAFGLAAGGMIVPGYLALSLHRPMDIVATLIVALTTFLIVKGISKFAIVYGRRRIVLMMLVGFVLGGLVRATPALAGTNTFTPGGACSESMVCVIGFIIPGLIALWMDRQGVMETLGSLMTASVAVRLVLIITGLELIS